jgi:hypothetical protein
VPPRTSCTLRKTQEENYRELVMRLSTALAMSEAAYVEVKRRRDV